MRKNRAGMRRRKLVAIRFDVYNAWGGSVE